MKKKAGEGGEEVRLEETLDLAVLVESDVLRRESSRVCQLESSI